MVLCALLSQAPSSTGKIWGEGLVGLGHLCCTTMKLRFSLLQPPTSDWKMCTHLQTFEFPKAVLQICAVMKLRLWDQVVRYASTGTGHNTRGEKRMWSVWRSHWIIDRFGQKFEWLRSILVFFLINVFLHITLYHKKYWFDFIYRSCFDHDKVFRTLLFCVWIVHVMRLLICLLFLMGSFCGWTVLEYYQEMKGQKTFDAVYTCSTIFWFSQK